MLYRLSYVRARAILSRVMREPDGAAATNAAAPAGSSLIIGALDWPPGPATSNKLLLALVGLRAEVASLRVDR